MPIPASAISKGPDAPSSMKTRVPSSLPRFARWITSCSSPNLTCKPYWKNCARMSTPKALTTLRTPCRSMPSPHRSEEHTSELQSPCNLVCRLLLEKKNHVRLHQYDHPGRHVAPTQSEAHGLVSKTLHHPLQHVLEGGLVRHHDAILSAHPVLDTAG